MKNLEFGSPGGRGGRGGRVFGHGGLRLVLLQLIADNAHGANRDWFFPNVSLSPTGELPLIQDGTDYSQFGFDVEVLFIARKLGFKILEFPVEWSDSPDTRVSPIKDSVRMFLELLKIRWKLLRL